MKLIPMTVAAVMSLVIAACTSAEDISKGKTTVYGDHAIVTLNDERIYAGELLLLHADSMWIKHVRGEVLSIPLAAIYDVEIFDTDVNAYLAPTLLAHLGPWTAIALSGVAYGAEGSATLILVGGLLAIVPVVANEAGMSAPRYNVNEVSTGALSQYLRFPFRHVSPEIRMQILAQNAQAAPVHIVIADSLQWKPETGE